ncbi:MAG: 3-hydroxyacyl-CoA dehydrogenase NAD-binding domain-containing protein [Pseudomonadota bacterium]
MDKKVTVVGAGNVGATAAQRLAEKELCDVVLIDISAYYAPASAAVEMAESILKDKKKMLRNQPSYFRGQINSS